MNYICQPVGQVSGFTASRGIPFGHNPPSAEPEGYDAKSRV
ncbi:MAG: hypothetical protein JWR16_179 [Nevskia sp.]|nr:hypothetical protein [Nevskia sp.]